MSKLPENPNSDQTAKPAPTAPAIPAESPSSPAPAISSPAPSLPSPSPAAPSASPITPAISAPSTNQAQQTPQAPAANTTTATPATQPVPAAPTPTPSPAPTAAPTNTTASSIPTTSTASAAPAASASSTPPTSPSTPTTPSAPPVSSAPASASVNFSADKIGQWAAKQEKPFAAQNQKEKAEKAKRTHARKKALPFIIICTVLALLLIGGIIVLIVALNNPASKVEAPEIYGSSDNDIYEYQDALSKVYQDNDNNLDAVSEAVDKTLATESGQANTAQVRIAEAYFFAENGEYQRAIDALSGVDPAQLSMDQQVMYYDTLYYANVVLGNKEQADEYLRQSYELRVELGGEGG